MDNINFNPHSREGSDIKNRRFFSQQIISIHTPAKGVTFFRQPGSFIRCNFNPHSREGSDRFYVALTVVQANFNPHSREGSDKLFKDIRVN
mgnify:CR=1 FL=1